LVVNVLSVVLLGGGKTIKVTSPTSYQSPEGTKDEFRVTPWPIAIV
jgi:hypothetical protein